MSELPAVGPAPQDEIDRHEAGLRALEKLRGELDDDVLDLATGAVRARIRALREGGAHGEQRLGQCSVMFIDVVGSTTLGGKLDPESIFLVMDAALERFTQIIERHGGRVLQYAGDSVLGAFGVDKAREDDASNAVAAGLTVAADALLLADRIRRKHAHPGFGVRVGIHTGPVLLGGGVEAEGTIRGATVNLAARMEQSAPTGCVRISAATHRQVRGRFEMDEQEPLPVKGYAEPQRTWLVRRRLPARYAVTARGVHGVHTPLVGRAAELAALQAAWQAWRGRGGVATLQVIGDAGLGKTRLLASWRDWAQAQQPEVRWLEVRAWPSHAELPQALLRETVATLLDLPESDSPELARERFLTLVTPLLHELGADAEREAQVLGHLLGLNFASSPALQGILQQGGQIRQRGWRAATMLMRAFVARQGAPVVLVLDDLHWADAESLRFLASLPAMDEAPPLLLATARRPGRSVAGAEPPSGAAPVSLAPLAPEQTLELAQALLAPLPSPPPGWAEALATRAAGNAFVLEELVQVMLDQGTLEPVAGGSDDVPTWRVGSRPFDPAMLPATLVDLLQARLAELPAAAARALLQAAVLGETFEHGALAALDPAAPAALPLLQERGLVQPRGLVDEGLYAFASPSMQQLGYARLLRQDRQVLHLRAGRWILALQTQHAADRLAEAAGHLEQGGDAPLACSVSLRAAEHLATRFAHALVVQQASRVLRLAEPQDRGARWQALLLRQRALRLDGQAAAQAEDLDALAALALRGGDPVQHATVAVRRMVAHAEGGHAQKAAEAYPAALAAAQAAGDGKLVLLAYGTGSAALRASGRHTEAQTAAEAGLALAQACRDGVCESEMLLALAAIATERGDVLAYRAHLQQALAVQQETGDVFGECLTRINEGVASLQLGDTALAEAQFGGALALATRVGHRLGVVSIRLNRSTARQEAGRAAEALEDANASLALARGLANPEYEAFSLLAQAAALQALGRAGEAVAACERSEALLAELGLPHLALEPRALRAQLAAEDGDLAQALVLIEPVLAHLARHGHLDGTERPLRVRLQCVDVLRAAADARAAPQLEAAWSALCRQCERLPAGPQRERYLQGHPHHRQLQALARQAALPLSG